MNQLHDLFICAMVLLIVHRVCLTIERRAPNSTAAKVAAEVDSVVSTLETAIDAAEKDRAKS